MELHRRADTPEHYLDYFVARTYRTIHAGPGRPKFAYFLTEPAEARGYSVRQAAYDLRKLRGKRLVDKPGRARRYHVPPPAARTIAALLTLRDQVIAPSSSPGSAARRWDANPRTGHASTVTTNKSASICKRSSTISPSKRR